MKILGYLTCGETVVERHNSYFHPSVADILQELFNKIDSQKYEGEKRNFIAEEIDLGRIIGQSLCVETTESDDIFYAQRAKTRGLTRFVKNREPVPSTKAVVILKWDDEESVYVLIIAFVGSKPEPEPWDRNATVNSLPFWQSHALIIDGSYDLVSGTMTKTCPW